MKIIILSFTDGIAPNDTEAIKKELQIENLDKEYKRIFELTGTTWTYEQTKQIWAEYLDLIAVELFTMPKDLMKEAILITLKKEKK